MPIFEPSLDHLVGSNAAAGRLTFTTDLAKGVKGADAIFIPVGPPSRRGDGHADLSYVYAAAKEIAESLDGPTVLVTKSTVHVGTEAEVEWFGRQARPDHVLQVAGLEEHRDGKEGGRTCTWRG